MIISASRRTDIPAFYSSWFVNRIKEGYLLVQNPFNPNQVTKVSLLPEDVDAIVFWTRNPARLMEKLSALNPYNYYFHYTITGYPRILEKSVPDTNTAVENFIRLSDLIGPEKVIWRYDPILLSNAVGPDEHRRQFAELAGKLKGRTKKVVISFAQFYKKTESNLNKIPSLDCYDILKKENQKEAELLALCQFLAETAAANNMVIQSCVTQRDFSGQGISAGRCIDHELMNKTFGLSLPYFKDKGQRPGCGCTRSIDVGAYNTCLHGCLYCYATYNDFTAQKNKKEHDINSPFLIHKPGDKKTPAVKEKAIQRNLF